MSIFKKNTTEGNRILNTIISDLNNNSKYVKSNNNFIIHSNTEWWQFIMLKDNILTVRDKDATTKTKNKHYILSDKYVEKFKKFYNSL